MSFRFLVSGFDTIECAYYLEPRGANPLDFGKFMVAREEIRQFPKVGEFPLPIGNAEFLLAGHGSKSGYPFVMRNSMFTVQCGEHNKPNFFVTYRSEALWHLGAKALHERFLKWAGSVGMVPYQSEGLSRVDLTFDYHLPIIDFDEDNFVTWAVGDNKFRKHKRAQTFGFGASPLMLRIYNKSDEIREKSGKTWFYPIWEGQENDVWRVEWEVRKDVLRQYGIRTYDDLERRIGRLAVPLFEDKATLRIKTADSNCSRWPLHPFWADLQKQARTMPMAAENRPFDAQAQLDEREMRLAISVYGYMKRLAAIVGLRNGTEEVGLSETVERLNHMLGRVHNPLAWETDVECRMAEMRMGQS